MSDTKHVVLIHGSWARGDSWGPALAAFEERGYTVHTPARSTPHRFRQLRRRHHAGARDPGPLVIFGEALPVTMGHIGYWIARNHLLANA